MKTDNHIETRYLWGAIRSLSEKAGAGHSSCANHFISYDEVYNSRSSSCNIPNLASVPHAEV
jgi:hypothetical protein